MWSQAVGMLPFPYEETRCDWFWLTIGWIKRYLEFCCGDETLCGYYADASEETECGQITDAILRNDEEGRIPRAISVFYDDSAYESYEPYYEKCLLAYDRLMSHVQWERLNPYWLRAYLRENDYSTGPDEVIGETPTVTYTNTIMRISSDYRIIGLLPPSILVGGTEWADFLIKLFKDYWSFVTENVGSGLLRSHNAFYQGPIGKDYGMWTMPEGVGLHRGRNSAETFDRLLDISRIVWVHFLTSGNWARLDGVSLRQYFDDNGYNDYLDSW